MPVTRLAIGRNCRFERVSCLQMLHDRGKTGMPQSTRLAVASWNSAAGACTGAKRYTPALSLQRSRRPIEPQQVQVGQRLAEGEGHLVRIQGALEHHRQHIGGRQGRGAAGVDDLLQALPVVILQLRDPHMQAREGLAVGGSVSVPAGSSR